MVTERERAAAKWVRAFEELDDNEFLLAYEICKKIISLRNGYYHLNKNNKNNKKWYVIPPTPSCRFCENYDLENNRVKDKLKCPFKCISYEKQATAFSKAWNNKEHFGDIVYYKEKNYEY